MQVLRKVEGWVQVFQRQGAAGAADASAEQGRMAGASESWGFFQNYGKGILVSAEGAKWLLIPLSMLRYMGYEKFFLKKSQKTKKPPCLFFSFELNFLRNYLSEHWYLNHDKTYSGWKWNKPVILCSVVPFVVNYLFQTKKVATRGTEKPHPPAHIKALQPIPFRLTELRLGILDLKLSKARRWLTWIVYRGTLKLGIFKNLVLCPLQMRFTSMKLSSCQDGWFISPALENWSLKLFPQVPLARRLHFSINNGAYHSNISYFAAKIISLNSELFFNLHVLSPRALMLP